MTQYKLFFAWLIAFFAMFLTLIASEILHWRACPLCWYQRVAIYPLVILLGRAAYRNETLIVPYATPFTVIGFLFAVYQYAEQMIPGFAPIDFCSNSGVSCTETPIKLFGFITIPLMSAVACAVMFFLLMSIRTETRAPASVS